MDVLDGDTDFNILVLPDIFVAPDAYDPSLLGNQRVIGIAIGRYFTGRTDRGPGPPWAHL